MNHADNILGRQWQAPRKKSLIDQTTRTNQLMRFQSIVPQQRVTGRYSEVNLAYGHGAL